MQLARLDRCLFSFCQNSSGFQWKSLSATLWRWRRTHERRLVWNLFPSQTIPCPKLPTSPIASLTRYDCFHDFYEALTCFVSRVLKTSGPCQNMGRSCSGEIRQCRWKKENQKNLLFPNMYHQDYEKELESVHGIPPAEIYKYPKCREFKQVLQVFALWLWCCGCGCGCGFASICTLFDFDLVSFSDPDWCWRLPHFQWKTTRSTLKVVFMVDFFQVRA